MRNLSQLRLVKIRSRGTCRDDEIDYRPSPSFATVVMLVMRFPSTEISLEVIRHNPRILHGTDARWRLGIVPLVDGANQRRPAL